MPKRKKLFGNPQKTLDRFSGKRGRGRPYKVRASEVTGRSYNYRLIFSQTWDALGQRLLSATTEQEVLQAFEGTAYKNEFEHIARSSSQCCATQTSPKETKKLRSTFWRIRWRPEEW